MGRDEPVLREEGIGSLSVQNAAKTFVRADCVALTHAAMRESLPSGSHSAYSCCRGTAKYGRMTIPAHLPRVDVRHDPLTCTCGQCGGLLETVGEEISEKLGYIPGRFQVIRHIRPKLACRPCGTIESPALPAQVIDKGLPTARLVAHVMTAKHVDHLPLYRQENRRLRAGVPISRATLCSWLGQGEYWISLLAEACTMALLEGAILHAALPLQGIRLCNSATSAACVSVEVAKFLQTILSTVKDIEGFGHADGHVA